MPESSPNTEEARNQEFGPYDLPSLFEAALSLRGDARQRYLDGACLGRPDLRRELESLIEASDPDRDDEHFTEPDPLPGRRIDDFRIERLIGEGGHGRVYLARQETPARDVALKIMASGLLSRVARRRFEFECDLLARLHHPGIAHVYKAGVESIGGVALPWFAMEYVAGARTVTDYIRAVGLPLRERVRLAISICEVLVYGHQNGVLHRDLKPSNILIGSDGQVKVIDFGVAGTLGGERLPMTLATHAGDILGTIAYMSPDQCRGDAHVADARTDTYALGAVFYEMFTLAPAFDIRSMTILKAIQTVARGSPTRPSLVNRAVRGDLEAIVLKALESEPSRRYQSAAELVKDLRAYLDGAPVQARRQTVFYRTRRLLTRRWPTVSAVAIVIGLLATTTLMFYGARNQEREFRIAEVERVRQLSVAIERSESDSRLSEAVLAFLSRQVLQAAPARSGTPEMSVREALLGSVARITEVAKGDLAVELALRRYAGTALQGMGELRAAAVEYERAIEIVDSTANREVPLLPPAKFVEALGAYGLILSAIQDPTAIEIQERAFAESKARCGDAHAATIQAESRLLAGRIKRDGFLAVRGRLEDLYERAISVLGVSDTRTRLVRGLLIMGLAYGDLVDRERAAILMGLELETSRESPKDALADATRVIQLEVLVANGDPSAIAVGQELVNDTAKLFRSSTPQATVRCALLMRALRYHGRWHEALGVARTRVDSQGAAETSSAADRMDAWLDLAVAAAEARDAESARAALASAEAERGNVPADSSRLAVAELDRVRANALLGDRGSAATHAAALRVAIAAITDSRPAALEAQREAGAVLARILAAAGAHNEAMNEARKYLDTCNKCGLQEGELAREMKALLLTR